MSALVKVMTGVAGLAAAVGFASPAAAQYYPGYGYGYNAPRSGVSITIGTGSRYGYGQPYGYGQQYGYGHQYGRGSQYAVRQCTRAAQASLGGGYGYSNYGGGRVLGVTSVQPRNSGLRVYGVASSGRSMGYGYNNAPDLTFSCKVDYRGRVVDLDFDRRYNSYGYNNGYYRGY
jgi:hypothetical protein